MEIINVINQKKRISIVTDDISFDVSLNTWARNYLRKGMIISNDDVSRLCEETRFDFLIEDGHSFLKLPKSQRELLEFLQKKDSELANQAFSYFISKGYVDDLKYSTNFVLVNRNKKGRNFIAHELSKKGVSEDIILEALRNITDEDELELLNSIIIKEFSSYHSGSLEAFKQKIINKLIEKGFSSSFVKKVVEENGKILDNIDEGVSAKRDYLILQKRLEKKYQGRDLENRIFNSMLNKGYSIEMIRKIRGDLNESEKG